MRISLIGREACVTNRVGLGHNSFSIVPIYTRDSTLGGDLMRNPFFSKRLLVPGT